MEKLSPEIMSYLLEFLPIKYRCIMATMNQKWYFASLFPAVQRKTLFVYTEPTKNLCAVDKKLLENYDTFKSTLINSKRSIIALKLNKLNYNRIKDVTLIENLGDRIFSLHLVKLFEFTGRFFNTITSCCKNLQCLELSIIHKFSGFGQLVQPVPKLMTIHFKNVRMSDMEFNSIIRCAPYLHELSVYACQVDTDPESINRYYPGYLNPEKYTDYNSNLGLTDVNIINNLKTAKNIKILNLDNCLNIFYHLPRHIKLNTLLARTTFPSKEPNFDLNLFIKKLSQHVSLKKLELINFPVQCLAYFSQLHNINHLSITLTCLRDEYSEEEVHSLESEYLTSFHESLKNMKNLKTIIINEAENAHKMLKPMTLPGDRLMSIKNLEFKIDLDFPLLLLGKSLETLRLQNCRVLQTCDFLSLLQNVTNLKVLELTGCNNLDDEVFKLSPISNIQGLNYLYIWPSALTLSSLRLIKLFHLKTLRIFISLEPYISLKGVAIFEENLKSLGTNSPMLEHIQIYLFKNERKLIKQNPKLHKAFSKIRKFKTYFKNVKYFKMII